MISVSPARKPRRVKVKFVGLLAIVLVFIMSVFAVAVLGVERRIRDQDLAERSAAVGSLLTQKLEKDINLMVATMRAMMTNRELEAAFRKRDRDALARQGGELFETLRTAHRITHLYFTDPNSVNFFRFHSPGEFGDTIERVTMQQASERQTISHGLEFGAMGTLTLRLVMPWKVGNELLGYVELGEEIEHLIDEIHRSLAIELVVLVEKPFLAQEQWQRGQTLMQRVGDWNRFATHATLARTAAELPAALDDALLNRLLAGDAAEIHTGNRSWHLALLPLDDAGGRHIGELVIMRDITDLEATFRWSIVAVTVISMLVTGGILAIFYFALGRVERDYRRQHDLEHQLLHLDTEHRRILQMEKLSAVGTMVGGIAHQLNNPLVGVVNLAQLAEREADDPVRTRELLREIRSAGEDCREFIKRMLAFSRVSGFECRPTQMPTLIEDTVLLFRQAEPRHLPVETALPEQPVVLVVDPVLIRHALFNLLVNAAQATADSAGSIRITLAREDDAARGIRGWSLAVSDHGCGMTADVVDRIFVPFFTTRSDGTGLGLPVVQHVALLHNGHVTVESEPGHGTRFAIWLPDTSPKSQELPASA